VTGQSGQANTHVPVWPDSVPMNQIQFQPKIALTQFLELYGTEEQCEVDKYAYRCLGAFCYRFNRRFHLEEMMGRILRATCNCTAKREGLLRSAELAT